MILSSARTKKKTFGALKLHDLNEQKQKKKQSKQSKCAPPPRRKLVAEPVTMAISYVYIYKTFYIDSFDVFVKREKKKRRRAKEWFRIKSLSEVAILLLTELD